MSGTEQQLEFIGLGYSSLDFCCLVERIPEDAKSEALDCLTGGGGPASTATCTAARLGLAAGFIGTVGDDARGGSILGEFEAAGVNTGSVVVRSGAESPAAFCWAERCTGRRSIVWTRGSTRPLDWEEVAVDKIRCARLLHLDGHHTEAAIHAAEIARNHDVVVSIDAGTILPGMERLLALADLVIASADFAATFTGNLDPGAAVRHLLSGHTRFAAITLGSKGCIGFDGKAIFRQPGFEVEVVDTTGAGDVFHGAFAVRLLEGADWQECLRFASAVAALKCRQLGGRAGIPARAEADQFLEKNS